MEIKKKNFFSATKNVAKRSTVAILCTLVIGFFLSVASCDKLRNSFVSEITEILEDSVISQGISPSLLIGKWDCIKFAYTANNDSIDTILRGRLEIFPITKMDSMITCPHDTEDLQWNLYHTNWNRFICSSSSNSTKVISDNSIKLVLCGSTYVIPSQEEIDIMFALEDAYRFDIIGDELVIYFTGAVNKDLLILKKDES